MFTHTIKSLISKQAPAEAEVVRIIVFSLALDLSEFIEVYIPISLDNSE